MKKLVIGLGIIANGALGAVNTQNLSLNSPRYGAPPAILNGIVLNFQNDGDKDITFVNPKNGQSQDAHVMNIDTSREGLTGCWEFYTGSPAAMYADTRFFISKNDENYSNAVSLDDDGNGSLQARARVFLEPRTTIPGGSVNLIITGYDATINTKFIGFTYFYVGSDLASCDNGGTALAILKADNSLVLKYAN